MNGRNVLKFFLFLIILLNLYYFVPYIYRSFVKIEKLKKEQIELNEKIEKTKLKIEDYNNKIDNLEDDFQRESIARNRLQMVKENEEIYRFIKN
ncbi:MULTISPECIES: septum formation initiator family protein [unclassified Fusobacterium]|uniref:FtsB family cell division protein n=1 Tax=unclassified Fusobacterium TaxID=2648384 RepID=UPI0025BDEC3D|nr:septum formation initiator family protein [Fusobacterium sp.]